MPSANCIGFLTIYRAGTSDPASAISSAGLKPASADIYTSYKTCLSVSVSIRDKPGRLPRARLAAKAAHRRRARKTKRRAENSLRSSGTTFRVDLGSVYRGLSLVVASVPLDDVFPVNKRRFLAFTQKAR